jgi:Kef-type K+ transport system membrane component KefB
MTGFQTLATILLLTALAGLAGAWLRQPLVLVYLVAGIALGPAALGWVTGQDVIGVFAEIGVSMLLFVVGLKLDLHIVRNLGPVVLAAGLGQLAFTILLGYLIALVLGMDHLPALYVATALTFSSTIIIVKLLTDKREIDSLHGRIAMGVLIVQDVAVIVAMTIISTAGAAAGLAASIGAVAGKLALLLAAVALLMRFALPAVGRVLARSPELLLVFALGFGTAFAALGEALGLSRELGAFLAGFALAATPYREAIGSRLAGIRDFLLLFFFIDLGAELDLATLGGAVPAALAFSAFVLVGNPLIVMAIMGYMGYRKRTGFLAGLTVAQISEFSIVFVAMGMRVGHVDAAALGLVTLVGLITITASVYMILSSHELYALLEPWLGIFERKRPFREARYEASTRVEDTPEFLIFGLGRYGRRLAERLASRARGVLGIDFDPEVGRRAPEFPFPVRFGDAEDPELLDTLPLASARWVVSTIPHADASIALVRALRERRFAGRIAVSARHDGDLPRLRELGADALFLPLADAANHAANELDRADRAAPGPRPSRAESAAAASAPSTPEADLREVTDG